MEPFITSRCPTHASQSMDPLSITASAIAIIQVTSELVTGTRSYYKNVKNSPKEISELVQGLKCFHIVLNSLKDISQKVDENPKHPVDQLARDDSPQQEISRLPMLQKMLEADGPLSLCYNEMLEFQRKLTKDQSSFERSLRWPFKKDEIKAVINRLRNL